VIASLESDQSSGNERSEQMLKNDGVFGSNIHMFEQPRTYLSNT
jgi:hypothetical protein